MTESAGGSIAHPEWAMRPLILEFLDPGTEARFVSDRIPRALRQFRSLTAFALFSALNMMLIIDHTPRATRLSLVMVGVSLLWFGATWLPGYGRFFTGFAYAFGAAWVGPCLAVVLGLPPTSAIVLGAGLTGPIFLAAFLLTGALFRHSLKAAVVVYAAVVAGGPLAWERLDPAASAGLIRSLWGISGGIIVVGGYLTLLFLGAALLGHRAERSERSDFALRDQLAAAHAESERLLRNVLPITVADRLKSGENPIADDYVEVSVVFADIVSFTPMAAAMTPAAVLGLLNEVFTRFDHLADRHGLEKIKTIGDAYMAVAGAPEARADHARAAAEMALGMVAELGDLSLPDGTPISCRVGISSGPVVAGVIGERKFSFDLWGDTVNTASRMESHGLPGRIQVSEATRDLIATDFVLEARAPITVKGKGELATWFLTGCR